MSAWSSSQPLTASSLKERRGPLTASKLEDIDREITRTDDKGGRNLRVHFKPNEDITAIVANLTVRGFSVGKLNKGSEQRDGDWCFVDVCWE